MRITGDLLCHLGDWPEIDELRDATKEVNPEFPCPDYPGGQDIALGLAIWKCDGHLDIVI